VIASHYAEPLHRRIATDALLRAAPAQDAEQVATLHAGDPFELLDATLGWAWGYAGSDRRVGYVPAEVLSA
jgi:hypothetical protein